MTVEQLLPWMQTASVSKRVQIAGALAKIYLQSGVTSENRNAVETAMTLLLEDSSSLVRFELANYLASSKDAPRHIITELAIDTKKISTRILACSPVFTDDELINIMASGTRDQQIAIACRRKISPALCAAIAEVGIEDSCVALLMNKNSCFSQMVLSRIAIRYGGVAKIRRFLLARNDLDMDTRMLLLEKTGEKLEKFIVERKWLSEARAEKTVREALDKSSILYAAVSDDRQIAKLLEALIKSGRLTTAYLFRAICMGNITLFCRALSHLSAIPCVRIEAMISQKRISAFRAVFIKSGMPFEVFEIFMTALNIWRKLLKKLYWIPRDHMPSLVVRQLIEEYQGAKNQLVDDLFILLQSISSDIAKGEARIHAIKLSDNYMKVKEKSKKQIQQGMQDMETSIRQELKADAGDLSEEKNPDTSDIVANDYLVSKPEMVAIRPSGMTEELSMPTAA